MAANIVSLPSLSSSLHTLPQATSLSNLALHSNMYAQRAAESEAKLQAALSRTSTQQQQQPPPYAYASTQQQTSDSSAPLMMRKKKFTT